MRKLYAALGDPAGVFAHRRGAFERIAWILADWVGARVKLADIEARMVVVLDELVLTELVCSIEGLSPVGAAAILAQTGDLRRFASARAVVKHAGPAPGSACPGPSQAGPGSPAQAGQACGWRRGGRRGPPCRRTGCTPPATGI